MIWNYPTIKDNILYTSKNGSWPVGGAYHILQIKENSHNLFAYNDDDFYDCLL